MAYLIGIDIGTSATKAILLNAKGKIVMQVAKEYPLYHPEPQWAEQDPEDWWAAVQFTLQKLSEKAYIDEEKIAGIGLTGQMHGLVMLDQEGQVLRKSIIWCDQRTEEECLYLERTIGKDKLVEITGNVAVPGFTLPKILWVKSHEPDIYRRCKHIMLPKDYIRFRLTGDFATDVSDASGMQLLDIHSRNWSDELLQKLDIDSQLFGKVYESAAITGYTNGTTETKTGIPSGTLVIAGAGDQAAAAIGNGIVKQGVVSCNIGSSGVVFAATDQPLIEKDGSVQTFCHALPRMWHVMGVTQGAGLSMEWLKNEIYGDPSANFEQINHDIQQSPIGSGGVFLPYLNGERSPHLDTDARGVFFGMDSTTAKANLARAVMEGVTFSMKECLDVIIRMRLKPTEVVLSGGGAKSKVWSQMIADSFGIPVKTLESSDAGSLGVALLAGISSNIYQDLDYAYAIAFKTAEIFLPNSKNSLIYQRYYLIYKELYQRIQSLFPKLSDE